MDWNKEKSRQLGMSFSKASHILRRLMMFHMAKQLGMDTCYRCNEKINDVGDFHMDHKKPWVHTDNPAGLFFDLENIAFSHSACNIKAARPRGSNPRRKEVWTQSGYKGVYKIAGRSGNNEWTSFVSVRGKRIHLGTFKTAKEAAIAYDKCAIKEQGEDTVTNQSLGLL